MITMEMIGKVRRMKLRDKLSISAIAKATRSFQALGGVARRGIYELKGLPRPR